MQCTCRTCQVGVIGYVKQRGHARRQEGVRIERKVREAVLDQCSGPVCLVGHECRQ